MSEHVFDRIHWLPDRLRVGDAELFIESFGKDHRDQSDLLVVYKGRSMIEQYDRFFRANPDFKPSSVLELGLWDGGSLVFWNEVLRPRKIVGLDLADRTDKAYFRDYVRSHGLAGRVVAYWRTDQADKQRLREIAASEFQGRLDLIIDDCSHIYAPTKASFEALFPLLAPGGWYILEDWDWAHQPADVIRQIPWARERSLTDLMIELVKLVGSFPDAFPRITIQPGFAAVQRGSHPMDAANGMILEAHILDKAAAQADATAAPPMAAPVAEPAAERVSSLESQLMSASELIEEYRRSRAWRLVEALRGLRVKAAPPGSTRERLWFAVLDLFGGGPHS